VADPTGFRVGQRDAVPLLVIVIAVDESLVVGSVSNANFTLFSAESPVPQ
jgi:hypothetical protein